MTLLPKPTIDKNGDYILPIHPETAKKISLPQAVWFEKVTTKSGKVFTKPRKGTIHYYNAIYHTIIMEIDGVPSAVPWDEVQILTRMKYKIYSNGGVQ